MCSTNTVETIEKLWKDSLQSFLIAAAATAQHNANQLTHNSSCVSSTTPSSSSSAACVATSTQVTSCSSLVSSEVSCANTDPCPMLAVAHPAVGGGDDASSTLSLTASKLTDMLSSILAHISTSNISNLTNITAKTVRKRKRKRRRRSSNAPQHAMVPAAGHTDANVATTSQPPLVEGNRAR